MKNKCDHCGQTEYRYAKVKEMLLWLIKRLESVDGTDMSDIICGNCELESWYGNHRRAYEAELRRKQEEKAQKISNALSKLTTEEKILLNLLQR